MSLPTASASYGAQPNPCGPIPGERSPWVSWPAGALACGCVLAAAGGPSALALATAGFLAVGVESDVRRLRIPNRLTGGTLLLALLGHAWLGGSAGLGLALVGMLLALCLGVPLWLAGALGAGDVKAAAALGALQGAAVLAASLVWSALFAGAIGLLLLAVSGELRSQGARWGRSLLTSMVLRRLVWIPPEPGSAAARVIPFGAVLALGTAAALAWGAPWA